jgi:4-hydroxy-3-methylbut-2-enyl diphosphate reductase
VRAAVKAASEALENAGGETVYCLHELVHNEHVVRDLKERGMVFVDSLSLVPEGARVLFSAHGVSPAVRAEAQSRNLKVVDATCPFVHRIHEQVRRFALENVKIIAIGHANHAETAGVAGEAPGCVHVIETTQDVARLPFKDDDDVGIVCQTTLGADVVDGIMAEIRKRWPAARTSPASAVCNATRERQNAVVEFVKAGGDCVVVLGSGSSSNSRRLVETGLKAGAKKAYLAGNLDDVRMLDLSGVRKVGVTSGASTPETLLQDAVNLLSGRL